MTPQTRIHSGHESVAAAAAFHTGTDTAGHAAPQELDKSRACLVNRYVGAYLKADRGGVDQNDLEEGRYIGQDIHVAAVCGA